MSNSNDIRSDLGLTSLVSDLIKVRRNNHPAFMAFKAAEKALLENERSERNIREELAAHIRAVGHNEIVILPDIAVYISVADTESRAKTDFLHPRS